MTITRKDIITLAEITAYKLLIAAGEIPMTTESINIHKEADKIIILAEKIKAERLTAGMLKNN